MWKLYKFLDEVQMFTLTVQESATLNDEFDFPPGLVGRAGDRLDVHLSTQYNP